MSARMIRLRSHVESVNCVSSDPTRPGRLISGGCDGNTFIWDINESNQPILSISMDNEIIGAVSFHPHDSSIFYISCGNRVMEYKISEGLEGPPSLLREWKTNDDEVSHIAVSRDFPLVLSCDDSGMVSAYRTDKGLCMKSLRGGHTSLCSRVTFIGCDVRKAGDLDFKGNSLYALSSGLDSHIALHDVIRGVIRTRTNPSEMISKALRLVDPPLKQQDSSTSMNQIGNPPYVNALELLPGGSTVAIGLGDGSVCIVGVGERSNFPNSYSVGSGNFGIHLLWFCRAFSAPVVDLAFVRHCKCIDSEHYHSETDRESNIASQLNDDKIIVISELSKSGLKCKHEDGMLVAITSKGVTKAWVYSDIEEQMKGLASGEIDMSIFDNDYDHNVSVPKFAFSSQLPGGVNMITALVRDREDDGVVQGCVGGSLAVANTRGDILIVRLDELIRISTIDCQLIKTDEATVIYLSHYNGLVKEKFILHKFSPTEVVVRASAMKLIEKLLTLRIEHTVYEGKMSTLNE